MLIAIATPEGGKIRQMTTSEVTAFTVAAAVAPVTITSQDLIGQFTADDAAKIRAAVNASAAFWLLWSALQAQADPMLITSDRFGQGWAALTTTLGKPRMNDIARALNAPGLVA